MLKFALSVDLYIFTFTLLEGPQSSDFWATRLQLLEMCHIFLSSGDGRE